MLLLSVWEMLTATHLQFTTHIHFGFIDKDTIKCIAMNSLIIQLTSVTEAEFYLSEVAEYFLK